MVSVVIPARNEVKNLPACIDGLERQKNAGNFEVIIVNNASTDQTGEIARSYTKKLNLRVIDEPTRGRGSARATGFNAARGEIILSTDADSSVPPDWIESVVSRLVNHPELAAISGTCRISDRSAVTNWMFNHIQPLSMRLYRLIFGHYWLTGSNFAIRRQAYQASGGFNPKVKDMEDHELAFRVKRVGQIGFMRAPAVMTSGSRYQDGLLKGFGQYIWAFLTRFAFKTAPYDRD